MACCETITVSEEEPFVPIKLIDIYRITDFPLKQKNKLKKQSHTYRFILWLREHDASAASH